MCDFIQQDTQTYAFRVLHRIHTARLHEAAAVCCPHQAVLLFYQTAGSVTVLSTTCGIVTKDSRHAVLSTSGGATLLSAASSASRLSTEGSDTVLPTGRTASCYQQQAVFLY
jgi:hypothetical protein